MSGGCTADSFSGRCCNLVPGEFLLTQEDFRRIAAMIHADSGIHLAETKAALVYSRLVKRLRALGLASFRDYCKLVAGAEGLDERQRMLAALTTNVTRFFREPHHFEHLEKSVLPPLIKAARRGARVRFWSAGCSSGEEPYSIALTLLSAMPDAGEHDIKILATDIDTEVLGRAKKGIYAAADLDPVPAKLRARWFVPVLVSVSGGRKAESCSVAPQLRNLIAFRDLNLFGPWPMGGKFQAIFCRNVAIYFENSAQEQLWDRFASKLAAQGFLYIGHSEQITGAARNWFEIENVTTYRLKNPTGKLP